MKKNIIIHYSLFIIPSLFLIPYLIYSPFALAAQCDRSQTPICSIADIFTVLNNIVSWMYRIFFVVAVLFILLAAYNYLTARGNPETIQKVNKQILYAVIAIIIAIVSVGFDVIIRKFLEQGN